MCSLVSRSMRGDEAKQVCPQIQLVRVPVARGKADLTIYRNAGSEVVAVLARKGRCERASIDEVYLDLTDAAEKMLSETPPESLEAIDEEVTRSHVLGLSMEGSDVREAVKEWICRSNADHRDKLLACGAFIVAELRLQVLKETQFSCSAGIAHNKMLAKLASGMNKPAQQTVVPLSSVRGLLEPLPIKKMKQLGGKLGSSLQSDLGVNTIGDLLQFSEERLQDRYGINTGTWLWNIARGINGDEVEGRLLPKSHGTGKLFPGLRCLKTITTVELWLNKFSEELNERLQCDMEQNKRIAHTLTLHASAYKSNDSDSQKKFPSKSCPLRYGAAKIQEDALSLFQAGLREYLKSYSKTQGNRCSGWGINSLTLSASKIVDIPSGTCSIMKYFRSQDQFDPSSKELNDKVLHEAASLSPSGSESFSGPHPPEQQIEYYEEEKTENGDIFVKYTGLKLPDTRQSWFNQSMDLEDCKMECLKNCSCTAYTTGTDIREGGMGCLLWFGDLIDIRDYGKNGLNLYIRMAVPKLEANRSSRRKMMVKICIIVIVAVVVLTILLGLFLIHVSKKKKLRKEIVAQNPENDARNGNEREDLELPLFDFQLIVNATDNFSDNKKLGEGGFGSVYKGTLEDGQEIAVKRLSKSSQQGLDEFKNEVSCIAKLQHRNLVRLLGCCIEEGEMLLIYEYMPNKSLDSFIFNNKLSNVLDWPKRYNIISGIAKGLLYLHQDSRLRIIHRDLKTSNILLDYEMNPRISDFGLARTFGGNETVVNTAKVVGTCGYMPPEYVIDGLFSVKSDVYSFGVVVLEMVSGKKIRGLYHSDHKFNLLSHAWKLHKEGNVLELIDGAIVNCKDFEVFCAIRIGLLCVQPYPKDRPSMSTVVLMLSSENELPQPKEPGFFAERVLHEPDSSLTKHSSCNGLTVTFFAPR